MRRLIINADDFGLTPGVNRAIVEAHRQGVVTSTTLMVSAPAFAEAAKLAAENPQLGAGCHVVLLDGSPLLPAEKIRTLADGGPDGSRLYDSLAAFAVRAVAGRLESAEIEAEAVAQIRKLQAAGLAVTHLDTHKHAHVFPVVWQALLRAARTCGIRALRNPFAPRPSQSISAVARRPELWKRYLEVGLLRASARRFRREVHEAGMITPDGSLGIVETGSLDAKLFEAAVSQIPEGTWEFVCHPGYHDSELARVRTRLRASRALELQVLTSPQAREVLERRGIQLISYRDLLA